MASPSGELTAVFSTKLWKCEDKNDFFGASFDLNVNCVALGCGLCSDAGMFKVVYSVVHNSSTLLLPRLWLTIPHVSITGSPHMFFILSCAAVLVATFSFIAIIACRPRHHSRSRVTCLPGTSLRLSLRCVGIKETRQKQRHNTKWFFFAEILLC